MPTFAEAEKANMKALGYSPKEENAFDEFLTLKALTAKRRYLVANPFGANMSTIALLDKKDLTRNLCVRIDLMSQLRLEAVLEIMETNKQEFVMEAIYDGIRKAEKSMNEAGISHIYEDLCETKYKSAGFSVEPNPHEDGFYFTAYKGRIVSNGDAERHEQAAGAWTGAAKALSDIIGEASPKDEGIEAADTSSTG